MRLPAVHLRRAWNDPTIWKALLTELFGVATFQVLASAANFRPFETAAAYTALMYGCKSISGGHLNPTVSLTAAAAGYIDWGRAVLYVGAQVAGAHFGALLEALIVPGAAFNRTSPGCLHPLPTVLGTIGRPQLFFWELLLTIFFVGVVFSSILARPGHGDASALAAGAALYTALATGGLYTGNSPLNPAVALASPVIFNCYWAFMWVYILAELAAICLVTPFIIAIFGKGAFYGGDNTADPSRQALLAEEGLEPGMRREDSLGNTLPHPTVRVVPGSNDNTGTVGWSQ